MLYCKYCNFYKKAQQFHFHTESEVFFCELTSVCFEDDVENLDIAYPCSCKSHLA